MKRLLNEKKFLFIWKKEYSWFTIRGIDKSELRINRDNVSFWCWASMEWFFVYVVFFFKTIKIEKKENTQTNIIHLSNVDIYKISKKYIYIITRDKNKWINKFTHFYQSITLRNHQKISTTKMAILSFMLIWN